MADLQSNKLTLTKIANGTSGKGIYSIVEQYAINNDGSNPPQESSQDWSSSYTPPTAINRYLWNREVITYTDNSSEITTPHVAAMYAEDGGEGRGISGISNLYAISNNGDTAPASGWESSPMAPTSAAKYLWNKEIITYTKGTPATTETARVIGTYSADGAPGAPGTNGLNQATVYLYARQATAPSAPSSVLTYRFSTGAIEETIPQPWSQTFPQNNGNPCFMAIAVAISNETTDTILPNEWTVEQLVKNGENGSPGQPGADGNGISSTSIQYAVTDTNVQPSTGWQPTLPSFGEGKWLWIKTTITYDNGNSDESVSKSYTGTDGQDGTSVTITNTSYDPVTKTTTITMNDGSGTPKTVSIKDGEDGNDGQPGAAGADGTPSYTHFAWANSADGQTDFSTTVSEGKLYIGVYSDSTQQDSQSPSSYSWTLIKGADGADGEDGEDGAPGLNQATVYLYTRQASPTTPTATRYNFNTGVLSGISTGWQQEIPGGTTPCYVSSAIAIGSGEYDNNLTFSTPAKLVEDGDDGVGIQSTAISYAVADQGSDPTQISSEDWHDSFSQITILPGQYLWIRTVFTYTDGTTSAPSYSVSREGQDGQDANSFTIHTGPNEILKFNTRSSDSDLIYQFSGADLLINGYNLITNTNLLNSNYTIEVDVKNVRLSQVIKQANYSEYVAIPIADTNSYVFHYRQLYLDLISGDIDSKIIADAETEAERAEIIDTTKRALLGCFNSINSEDIHIAAVITENNQTYNAEKFVQIKNGLSDDMMKFDVNAGDINAAIQNTGLNFSEDGLTITNGGFKIQTQAEGESPIPVLEMQSGRLYVDGSGYFSGTIHAEAGEFNGTVTAAQGSIGGFIIGAHNIQTEDENLYLQSSYIDEAFPTLDEFEANKTKYYTLVNNEYVRCQPTDEYDAQTQYYEDIPSLIRVENISIGNGAVVDGQIQVGNLSITKPGSTDGPVITLNNDGTDYFVLKNNGDIIGDGWRITNDNGETVAHFDNGEFHGYIDAQSGRFSGEITASVINATTINTINFVTQKTRSMGGAFIFKPVIPIDSIENTSDTPEQDTVILKINYTNTDNASEYFKDSVGSVVIFSGENNYYGKIVGLPSQGETEFYVKIQIGEDDETNIKNLTNTLTLLGKPTTQQTVGDCIIGINSDSDNSFLAPRSLSIKYFEELILDNNRKSYILHNNSKDTRLLLGDLTSQKLNGYGLYADNVFLKGSLTTTVTNPTEDKNYAGVNTAGVLYDSGSEPSNEIIVFWAGADGTEADNIRRAPFIVTDKGNIYAQSGSFEGSVISNSIITNSEIIAPVIRGNGEGSSLKLISTAEEDGGIGFYEYNNGTYIITLKITNKGLYHYYTGNENGQHFISFDSANGNTGPLQYINLNEIRNINLVDENTAQTQISNGIIKFGNNDRVKFNESESSLYQSNSAYIKVTPENIENNAPIVKNKNIVQFVTDNISLTYKKLGNYYCLFVE